MPQIPLPRNQLDLLIPSRSAAVSDTASAPYRSPLLDPIAVPIELRLLEPVQAEVMTAAPDQVRVAVPSAVHAPESAHWHRTFR